jgi:hypothetical protein
VATSSKAASLVSGGVSVFDSEVHGWMIGASDELIETELNSDSGGIRHQVLVAIAAIERRDAAASEIVTPHAVWSMQRQLDGFCPNRKIYSCKSRFGELRNFSKRMGTISMVHEPHAVV